MFTIVNTPEPPSVKSAVRVLDLFELLARRTAGLSHTDLAELLEIPKSSLTQLIKTLAARGFLAFDPAVKTYRLGAKFSQLARLTSQVQDLVGLVEPLLADVTAATGESSALNTREGNFAKVVAAANSPQRLVSHLRLGDVAPLYATSGGKAILAHLTEDQLKDYFAEVTLDPITSKTLVSETELRRQLDAVRREGLADVFEEYTPGIVGVAVPVLSNTGELLGAINIAMPSLRYSSQARVRAVDALNAATAALRQRLPN